MDSSGRILNCDSTSLLNLKAELYRKQEACKLAKVQKNCRPLKRMTIKGQSISSKNKEKEVPETSKTSEDSHEDEMLQKSRKILEAKAKIYDQIVEKKVTLDEEFSDNYLVDFQRKELFERSVEDKESDLKSNHTDEKCDSKKDAVLNEDLTSVENLESCISKSVDRISLGIDSQSSSFSHTPQEETETETHQATNGPTHYENVRFNEIRDHGVGYFAFSEDEKERQEQMDLLKTLRQETIENKQVKEKLKQKKQALLQSRLAKVCQRRNIDSSVLQVYTKNEENEVPEKVEAVQSSESPANHSNTTEPDSVATTTSKKIRPWDIGKSDFDFSIQTPKRKSGAEKWIDHKREERNEEFAPPSFYFGSQESKTKKFCQGN